MAPWDINSYMQPVPLLVELHATVLSCWRDSDGYGSTDSDFWMMTLHVQSWPSETELRARIRSYESLDVNALYSIKGRLYINPGKEWTETYVRVDLAQKFHGPGTIRSDMCPTFEVVAHIKSVQDTYLSLEWSTSDGYQDATYGQSARVNLAKRIPRAHTFVNVLARITGTMDGLDHEKQWQCICLEPKVSAPSSPPEYLDSIVHSLTAVRAVTQMP